MPSLSAPFVPFLLFFGLAAASIFPSCLPDTVASFAVGSPQHANLTSQSFRNNLVQSRFFVLARSANDVSHAVKCAAKAGLKVCARSGGHSFVAKSLCPGVVIDVSRMNNVYVHPTSHVATVGAGANMGELLWAVQAKKRWVAAGVCPQVGVGGFMFGGGHGPYEGKLGLACDSLKEVTLVTRNGWILKASRTLRQELFWGLCGSGGGQFGIITSFKMYTAPSAPYDNSVVFRYHWPQNKIGVLLEKWMRYDEEGGDVRVRMEMNKAPTTGMNALGMCFGVSTVAECEAKLSKAEFWSVPGRKTELAAKAKNAIDMHAFMGPEGDWGRKFAPNLYKAMLQQRFTEGGAANERAYQSTFMKKAPPAKFWQEYGDFCAYPKLNSIPWIVCELRLMKNAVNMPKYNAYAHRDNTLLTHYIIGGGTPGDKMKAYQWMANHLRPYTTGVYVNYEELELKNDYPRMYWGKNLCRLRGLKAKYDPGLFFANVQPIPPTRCA